MTIFALQAKITRVDFRFFMAVSAAIRRASVLLLGVTGLAGYFRVPALQRVETVVIEVAHPIDAVMTGQAIPPKLGLVFFHEIGGLAGMAIHTIKQIKCKRESIIPSVAICASEEIVGIICLVMVQAEPGY